MTEGDNDLPVLESDVATADINNVSNTHLANEQLEGKERTDSNRRPGVIASLKEKLFNRFADPRDCKNLDDVVGRKVEDATVRARRIDWVPRRLDVARIAGVIQLVQQQKIDGSLRIVDIAGHNGFLDRLVLDELDSRSSGNVEVQVVDPDRIVARSARNYYSNKEPRLKFITEKAEQFVKKGGTADVVICSWMLYWTDLRPCIEQLKPKVIIFVKDIYGDVGGNDSFKDSEQYKQVAAWLGFSGHDIDNYRTTGYLSRMGNVILVMTDGSLGEGMIKETLENQTQNSLANKYPWEEELPVTERGIRVHERDDFSYYDDQTEND